MSLDVVLDGLGFPEGARWHDDSLFFSDFEARVVRRLPAGRAPATVVAEVPGQPSGLGWDPDGALLVVSMLDRRLLRVTPGGDHEEVADLGGIATHHANDLLVDGTRAYVGNFGYDRSGGAPPAPAALALVDVTTGAARVAAEGLHFPNGMARLGDDRLIVAETTAQRLTSLRIADDGTLHDPHPWADIAPAAPDGIALDAEGAVWVASPPTAEVLRVAEGGRVLQRVATGPTGRTAFACALGGAAGRTLFVCASVRPSERTDRDARPGAVLAIEVDVPAAP